MSIQAVAAVLDADVGEVAAKMLLVCIANAHNTTSGVCCPSIDRLAAESGMSRSSVKRWLRWLEERRYLRVVERRDPTGRQLAHGFELTLAEGVKLTSSLQDVVEGSELTSREATGEPGEGVTGEPPLKKPEEKPNTPQPPSGGLGFADLWEAWPQEQRGSSENAEGAFNRLTIPDRVKAIQLAPIVASAFRRRKGARIPALVRYIRERLFVEFDGAPPLDRDGHFIIKPGTPEWRAWLGWLRRKYGEKAVERTVLLGHFLPPTRWPEGHVQGIVA